MTVQIEDKNELEIAAELLSNVPDTYQKNVGYFIWDLMRAIGKVFAKLWQKLQYLCAFFDIENLEYDDLVKFVFQRKGIIAKTESYASGLLKVTSGSGTITAGDIFQTSGGLEFKSKETIAVDEGDTFEVECLTAGTVGNVPVDSITVIPVTIQGIVSVTNENAFTGGYEKESKESIISRYYQALQEPITSNNIYHYKKWALEVTGVGDAIIKPLWNGDNTVKVIIANGNKQCADSTLVQAVQNYIDPYELVNGVKVGWGCGNGQANIGCYCTVESGTKLNIDVEFDAEFKTGVTVAEGTASIRNSIENYLKTTVFKKDITYVSYALLLGAIVNAEGVKDISNLLINNDVNNIPIQNTTTACEIAMLNNLTIRTATT